MKKLLLVLAIVLLPSFAFAVSLAWDPVTTNTDGSPCTDLAGYNAYSTTSGKVKLNTTPLPPSICVAGVCSYTLTPIPAEGNSFVVTAVDVNGNESGDSNTATYHTTPSNPAHLLFK